MLDNVQFAACKVAEEASDVAEAAAKLASDQCWYKVETAEQLGVSQAATGAGSFELDIIFYVYVAGQRTRMCLLWDKDAYWCHNE